MWAAVYVADVDIQEGCVIVSGTIKYELAVMLQNHSYIFCLLSNVSIHIQL